MLFTTFTFLGFLAAVLTLFYLSPGRYRVYLLLISSLLFYMAWNVKYVILLLGLITVDYAAALWIDRASGWKKRAALLPSLAANIGMLGWFKYANFVRAMWGGHPLDILLPLGISFHTFQSISYVVDVYRGQQKPVKRYADYALFVSFFPQLTAGPIVRAREFFHDLYLWKPATSAEWQQGVALILTGYVKKLIFADQFALVADAYFAKPASMPGLLPAWSAAIAFGLQIFFDFSGYTDIAIGVALLFGFHFPENFRRPYLAASITEFWRRWHMTLSRWLRDYIYIPLGGNRHGAGRTYLNLLLTMLLGGLWHGASWTFVIWGGYHGVLLALERMLRGRSEPTGWLRVPHTVLTFALVTVGWVFFRAKTPAAAMFVVRQMASVTAQGASLLGPWQWALAAVALTVALFEEHAGVIERLAESPAWVRTAAAVAALLAIELFTATDKTIPFVYFQF